MIQGQAELTNAGNVTNVGFVGVTVEYADVQTIELSEGEFFSPSQITGLASAAILGTNVAEDMFGRSDGLIGETVRVAGQPFRVVGILKNKADRDWQQPRRSNFDSFDYGSNKVDAPQCKKPG